MLAKLLELVKKFRAEIILAVAVALIALTSYNLGKIVAIENFKTPVTILETNESAVTDKTNTIKDDNSKAERGIGVRDNSKRQDLSVVASKKSKSKFFHFDWCPGAGLIAPQNKLTFTTEAAAIAAGFTLANNCKK